MITKWISLFFLAGLFLGPPGFAQDEPFNEADTNRVIYRRKLFLNVPFEAHGQAVWRVFKGQLQTSSGKGADWINAAPSLLPRPVEGDWFGIRILGAPAVASQRQTINVTIHDQYPNVQVAAENNQLFQIGQRLKALETGEVDPEIGVFVSPLEGEAKPEKTAAFEVDSSPFQFRLAKAVSLEGHLLAIIFDSRHSLVNKALLFDTSKSKVIGQFVFSELGYDSQEKSLWVVRPLPHVEETDPILQSFEESAKRIPLPRDDKVSPELMNLKGVREVK